MTVYKKAFALPEPDRREILLYAGVMGASGTEELSHLTEECITLAESAITPRVCYAELAVSVGCDSVDFGVFSISSSDLCKNLWGCERAVIFAATVGSELDRLYAREAVRSPAMALMISAFGSERIEALCNIFNRAVKAEAAARGESTAPRFSPGYGDLPLSAQRDIFALLECPRNVGISLCDSLMMSPKKSVTAIIGIRSSK